MKTNTRFTIGKPTAILPSRQYESMYTSFFQKVDNAKGMYVPIVFKTVEQAYTSSKTLRKICVLREKKYEMAIRKNSIYIRTR